MKTKNPLQLLAMLFAVSALVLFTGCGDDDDDDNAPTMSVLEIIQGNSNYSEFVDFYTANSDALPALDGETEYTVFVPNNNAFDGLRETLGVENLESINPEIIAGVLTFHFVSGKVFEADFGTSVATVLSGESITFNEAGNIPSGTNQDPGVTLGVTDQEGTNGVVHEVNSVLIPSGVFSEIAADLNLVTQAIFLGADFTGLIPAIEAADEFAEGAGVATITEILRGDEIYTLFAPTNGTLEAAGDAIANLTGQQWYGILANHVVFGEVTPSDLTAGATFTTAAGAPLTVVAVGDPTNGLGIYLDSNGDQSPDAEVAVAEAFKATNGVLHVIAGILTPPQ